MSSRDFIVKNGLQVNNGVWVVNTAGIYYNSSQWANSTFFNFQSNTAINANNLTGANTVANNTGFYYNGEKITSGGGYYKGNDGTSGEEARKGDLYRINSNTQTNNVTISAGENALTVGPITIDDGYILNIETGGRVVVV